MRPALILPVVLILVIVFVNAAFFIVDEREQVVLTQLGEPKRILKSPGLYRQGPFCPAGARIRGPGCSAATPTRRRYTRRTRKT